MYAQTYLITGGCGFIGSNFIRFLLDARAQVRLINLDALTYAGNRTNLSDIEGNPRYTFVHGNICDTTKVDAIFREYGVDCVVNFAAETHVDRSISGPSVFVTTNVLGTANLLETAKQYWLTDKSNRADKKFVQISTDEVYGALPETGYFKETTSLAPNSPYSASKASADMMVRAYGKTYGLPVNITRCSNNYGPFQYPEKLIPLMISNALNGLPLPVYGDGKQVRDWLHVHDHCEAILTVIERGKDGEVYNIGGNNEMPNIELVRHILKTLGKSEDLIKYVADRPGHDRRYAIDNNKIKTELGWKPTYTFERGITETIEWYSTHQEWLNTAMRKTSI